MDRKNVDMRTAQANPAKSSTCAAFEAVKAFIENDSTGAFLDVLALFIIAFSGPVLVALFGVL